ncbi:MAG TPA: hypothetical protein VK324_09380 [Tepidisphaeraceae bacterium]|nr:hypothetical protein [Tepidisphaeraceae bacterium]
MAPAAAEAFIDVVIGLVVIALSWQVFDFAMHKLTGRPFSYPVTDAAGNPVPYTASAFFWMNLGTAAFGVALVLSAPLALMASRRATIGQAVVMGIAAVLGVIGVLTALPVLGLQIIPMLAAAFAVYLAWVQIAKLRR